MEANKDSTGGNAMNEREITERIALIESMMQAGRKSTEYWGWNFLLWASRTWSRWRGPASCRMQAGPR
jgi:hypothetical protein